MILSISYNGNNMKKIAQKIALGISTMRRGSGMGSLRITQRVVFT
jgi:hypothetical protein